jgi:NAD(P)-dependent dehydrogenase (short-subunit alcohol dehydrogenase family)
MDLDGKVAVITGGSTGIGRATARAFADRDMELVLASRRVDRLQRAVAELLEAGASAIGVPADIGRPEEVARLASAAFDAFGRVDVAFLNAGAPSADRLLAPDLRTWRAAVETTVLGLVNCLQAFLPRMLAQDGRASVLATTSGAGIHGTAAVTAPYAATKGAQLSIMESLYGQIRAEGVDLHVGVVVPPLTRTNLAGDDLSVWEHVAAGLAAHGLPAAVIEPEAVATLVVEGLERETFWIEADLEQDARLFGGRNRENIERVHQIIRAKADAMIGHQPPDAYLW